SLTIYQYIIIKLKLYTHNIYLNHFQHLCPLATGVYGGKLTAEQAEKLKQYLTSQPPLRNKNLSKNMKNYSNTPRKMSRILFGDGVPWPPMVEWGAQAN
ncbi:hypothetical protein, partial [Holospora undulata]|uniref:hypothetical protein n=1 Tax=Holospora undulata TaxID=1169117 RepID=UPI001F2F68F6